MKPAVQIENLSKRYTITHKSGNRDGLRHALESAVRQPLAWIRSAREQRQRSEDFWALRHVSLEIQPGEVVGIIGRNGAGKSTLLKLLSRITVPTEGRIRINGRVASLLEVGTGFHQELTGRENIFLNGAILGMSRSEIVRKFDEIVAFSEVEEFLDVPVKRYSSGMYVRLAFAVAAHLEPEILIIDEVLAVGDVAFQKKCLGKMGSFAESGRTVLFVSHNMEAVRGLCQRCVWMKQGAVHQDGESNTVLADYFNDVTVQSGFAHNAEYGLTIERVALKNSHGQEVTQFAPGDDLIVEVSYQAERPIETPMFAIGVVGATGSCFTSNMLLDGHRPSMLEGRGRIVCTFRSIPLLPQTYTVKLSVRAATASDMIIPYQEVGGFNIVGDLADYGYRGDYLHWARTSTSVVVPYEWQLPDGRTIAVDLSCSQERAATRLSLVGQ
jgi:lipopolysaccharide transport system ATP-binding protein